MEPENAPLEKEKHLQTTNFLGSMLVLGGVFPFTQMGGLDFPEVLWNNFAKMLDEVAFKWLVWTPQATSYVKEIPSP